MNFDENKSRLRNLDGMNAALAHAFDMNKNGRLDEKELNEFQRYLVSESITLMTSDEYAAARGDGRMDQLMELAGQDPRSAKPLEPRELAKYRKEIAGKIAADYLGQMWEGGHLDDADYASKMESIGAGVPQPMEIGEEQDAGSRAEAAWQQLNGGVAAGGPTEAANNERAEMEEYAKQFQARQARQNGSSGTVRERVVDMPK